MPTKILKITIQIKKRKVLIIFNDMNADMINNKKLNIIATQAEAENLIFLFSLLHNLILKSQKMLY